MDVHQQAAATGAPRGDMPKPTSAQAAHAPVRDLKEQGLAKVAVRGVDLEPIDRLEEKVKLLVGMIDRLRAEQARTVEDNTRLTREIDTLRARLADADATGSELVAMREERDVIRTRVNDMLQQIESLNI